MSKQVIVIAGPSGSGKNAIISRILERYHNGVRLVTATTRVMRPGEVDGVDYHFFTQERFDQELSAGHIPEHRFVPALGTYYGIYTPDLDKHIKAGKIVYAQVDIEGARLLKERYGATTIFIMPESIEQFRGRLRSRNPEWSQKELDARMKITENELRVHAPEYDYRVVNADGKLSETIDDVIEIMRKEGYTLS
ncbi:MAG: guanylate kinase [Parcubacteria group bacterium Athens0416_74]|jgi:guanylate kinase|nr:MAG: guanylate kinase [Parcubacteria group bacterium Athens0416_74]